MATTLLQRRTSDDRARGQRQDRQLMQQHRDGDRGARTMLIERYMPLARSLALRYRRASEPLDDLFQVAAVGLVKAVDRWEPDRGLAFSSYAVPTILGELRRYFRDSTWAVRPTRDMQELCLAVEEARDELWIELGRSPTVADLSAHLDRQAEEVLEALEATEGRTLRSLDAPVHEEEGHSAGVGELIGAEDPEYARVDAGVTIERLSGVLDDRAREILLLRFREDLLQSEIAERVGCSQMHVSRIIRASLDKLYQYAGMTTTLEVRPPTEPATPVVPDAPAVPADPTPSRETPDTPTGPEAPPPDDPLPPQPDGPDVPDPAQG